MKSSHHSTWMTVTLREAWIRISDKGFIVSTIITLTLVVLASTLPSFLRGGIRTVAVTDNAGEAIVASYNDTADSDSSPSLPKLEAKKVNLSEVDEELRSGSVNGALVKREQGWEYMVEHTSFDSSTIESGLQQAISSSVAGQVLSQFNIDAASITAESTLTVHTLNSNGLSDNSSTLLLLEMLIAILFVMSSLTFGVQIAQSIVVEKESRIIEILLSTVSAKSLLVGKVFANTILAFIQLLFITLIGTFFYKIENPSSRLFQLGGKNIVWFLVFFIVGFLSLACLWAAAGATATKQQDLQSASIPLTTVLLGSYAIGLLAHGQVQLVASYFPIASSSIMPIRILEGNCAWWEPVVSLLIACVFCILAMLTGSRIYQGSLMSTTMTNPLKALRLLVSERKN